MPNLQVFGDSISALPYIIPGATSWSTRVAAARGLALVDNAINGITVAEQFWIRGAPTQPAIYQGRQAYANNLGANDAGAIGPMINDARLSSDAVAIANYGAGLMALAAHLAVPGKQNAATAGIRSGSWALTQSYGPALQYLIGQHASNVGDTDQWSVTSSVIYVWYIAANGTVGGFNVLVDGVVKASVSVNTSEVQGAGYSAQLVRIPMGSVATRNVEVVVTQAGFIGVDFVGGNGDALKPPVYVCSPIHASGYPQGGSDAAVDLYFGAWSAAMALLVGDGLNITPVNVRDVLNKTSDMAPNDYHPSDAGQLKIANAVIAAMPPLILTAAPTYLSADSSVAFIGDGAARRQLQLM